MKHWEKEPYFKGMFHGIGIALILAFITFTIFVRSI